MDSRARVRAALDHREPDRVPRDLGAVADDRDPRPRLRRPAARARAAASASVRVGDLSQQLAVVDDDVADALGLDVRGVEPRGPSGYRREMVDEGEYRAFRRRVGRPAPDAEGRLLLRPVRRRRWAARSTPATWPASPGRTAATPPGAPASPTRRAGVIADEGRAVYVGSVCAGLTEMLFRLRGFEDGYMDLAADPALARALMERVLEIKLAWWGAILPELGDAVDVVGEADDLGGQATPLFSPRDVPRAREAAPRRALRVHPGADAGPKVFFHSCGAIRELLPDLVEIGVDILNPVQVSAAGMETARAQARLRARPRLLGRRRGHPGRAGQRDAGRGAGRGARAASPTWRRAAASSSRRSTTSRPTCRPENVAAMWEAVAATARTRSGADGRRRAEPARERRDRRPRAPRPRRARPPGADRRPRRLDRRGRARTRPRPPARSSPRASSTSTSTAGAATTRWARTAPSTGWPGRCCATASPRSCRRPSRRRSAELAAFAERVRRWMPAAPDDGAGPLGFNLEGPFIDPSRKGAQNPAHIRVPAEVSTADLEPLVDGLRIMTIAPEVPGALDLIALAAGPGRGRLAGPLRGHRRGGRGPATRPARRTTTHLFNAMTGVDHRAPGARGRGAPRRRRLRRADRRRAPRPPSRSGRSSCGPSRRTG